MNCEKVVHGDREYKPFPKFYKLDERDKKVPIRQPNFPYKCDREAVRYRVKGASFAAIAVLCQNHKRAAEREGFKLEPITE